MVTASSVSLGCAAASCRWLWFRVQEMTTVAGVYLLAWAVGYVLGYKVRMVKTVMYAA